MPYSHQRGLSRIEVLVTILVTLVVLAIFVPPRRSPWNYNGSRTEALNNAKALAGGLVAFKTEMGRYPCDATGEAPNQIDLSKTTRVTGAIPTGMRVKPRA